MPATAMPIEDGDFSQRKENEVATLPLREISRIGVIFPRTGRLTVELQHRFAGHYPSRPANNQWVREELKIGGRR